MALDLVATESLSNLFGRHAGHDRISTHIVSHYCSSCDYSAPPDGYARQNNRAIPDPYVVFDSRYLRDSSWRVPDGLSDHVEAMINPSNKRDVSRNQDMISNFDVALNYAARAKLNAVAKLHDLIRSPNRYTPRNPNQTAPASVAAPYKEIDTGSQPVNPSSHYESQE